jgi:hypothetical protein
MTLEGLLGEDLVSGKDLNGLERILAIAPAEWAVKVRIDPAVKAQWIDPKTGVLTGTS